MLMTPSRPGEWLCQDFCVTTKFCFWDGVPGKGQFPFPGPSL